jgi:hypothetical protein
LEVWKVKKSLFIRPIIDSKKLLWLLSLLGRVALRKYIVSRKILIPPFKNYFSPRKCSENVSQT